MPEATITTAIYDSKRKVLIPKETPLFTDIEEVMVVFVPKMKARAATWNGIIKLFEKSGNNESVPTEELDDVVSEAIAAVRRRPKEKLILD